MHFPMNKLISRDVTLEPDIFCACADPFPFHHGPDCSADGGRRIAIREKSSVGGGVRGCFPVDHDGQ